MTNQLQISCPADRLPDAVRIFALRARHCQRRVAGRDQRPSARFMRANRAIEVIDVNAAGEPLGAPRIVVPTATLESMSDRYRS